MRQEIERIREAIEKGSFPDEAAISNGVVLRALHLLKWPAFDTDVGPAPRPRHTPKPKPRDEDTPSDGEPERTGFTLNGKFHSARSGKAVLVKVLEELSSRDATFAERMAARPKHGGKRRYIARTPEDLYPDRPDLARDYSYELDNGWWVGVNYGTLQIKNRIIAMAAEVAGLQYGQDLIVHLKS